MRAFGARDHLATVTGSEWLAPHFLRVRFVSETLFSEVEVAPTEWLRFWFPDPDGGDTEYQRAYTLSEADAETGAFACDFVMHEPAGPACLWAKQAQPGDRIAAMISLTAPFAVPEELPAGFLLVRLRLDPRDHLGARRDPGHRAGRALPRAPPPRRRADPARRPPAADHLLSRPHRPDSLAAAIEARD